MGRVYRSDDRKLPREVRSMFADRLQKHLRRPVSAAIRQKAFDPEGEMTVEGIANLAELDRWDEIIPPEAWNLDNFKLNPIVLYEHDWKSPVGYCPEVFTKPDGLHYVAVIGNPKVAPLTPDQFKVRSLIAQTILRANSVGFIGHRLEWDEDQEFVRYLDVELLEITFCAIPMQQGSGITGIKSWRKKMADNADAAAGNDMQPHLDEIKSTVKDCHGMLTKMMGGYKSAADTANAEIKRLTDENAALKTQNAELETKTGELLDALTKQGVIKPE